MFPDTFKNSLQDLGNIKNANNELLSLNINLESILPLNPPTIIFLLVFFTLNWGKY